MNRPPVGSLSPRTSAFPLNFLLVLAVFAAVAIPASAQFTLEKISTDTFTDSDAQHATEVEPDTFAYGSTIVSAFQVGRIYSGGGSDIGFATSTNGGKTWTSGYLPGLTVNYQGGSFSAASDAAVAYDAAHGVWLISTLPIGNNDLVAVSRSQDGISWGTPILVTSTIDSDKNWIVCDDTATSPFYGHCYAEWDSPEYGDLVFMSTSTDGGLTWGAAKNTADTLFGIGGQPLVQPNGNVVVPIVNLNTGGMSAFGSTNGGASWTSSVNISDVLEHGEAGGLRSAGLPAARMDGAGNIYVVWSDCRFRTNCNANDLVLSTSKNGATWTTPARLPMVPVNSAVDLFIPGLGVDPATSGASAHLTVTTYAYANTNCSFSTCQLYVGFTTSQNGGKTWAAGKVLAGPMSLSWLPNTFSGYMVADYLSVSYANGQPFGVFAVAKALSGGTFNQAMYTTTTALLVSANEPTYSSRGDKAIPGVKSDKGPRKFYDDDGEYPIPPKKKMARKASRK
ncbi:MAG: sialidase family protein [Terriglobales bacterium]